MSYLIYFYPTIIALGIATSYTDMRFHVIKNRHLVRAVAVGIATYIFLIVTHKIALDIYLILNPLVALGIGFLLYITQAWGAGDAKLFMVLCLLMPTTRYAHLVPFPSVTIFANIFLLSTVVIVVVSLVQLLKNIRAVSFKEVAVKLGGELLRSLLIILCLDWIVRRITDPLKPYLTPFLIVLMLYFSYWIIYGGVEKIKNKLLASGILGMGLLLRYLARPADFALVNLTANMRRLGSYTLLFNIMRTIFEINKDKDNPKNKIAFAPLIFAGTLISHTTVLYWVMEFMKLLRK